MKKGIISILLLICVSFNLLSQAKYFTENGYARFFSEAPLENIEAATNELMAVIDFANGEILFLVRIKSFEFERNLMQRHFNEQFMESDKFPEARFSGKILNFNPIISFYNTPRTITVTGNLTIHGVTREITEQASLQYIQNQLVGETVFNVKVADYDIKIPRLLIRNIAEIVEVTIKVNLERAGD
jgi:polyisoprenoid-binding protein YceI